MIQSRSASNVLPSESLEVCLYGLDLGRHLLENIITSVPKREKRELRGGLNMKTHEGQVLIQHILWLMR